MKSFNVIEVMKFWKFMKSFCGSFLTSYKDSYLQKPFGPYKEAPFKLLMLLHQMNFFFYTVRKSNPKNDTIWAADLHNNQRLCALSPSWEIS